MFTVKLINRLLVLALITLATHEAETVQIYTCLLHISKAMRNESNWLEMLHKEEVAQGVRLHGVLVQICRASVIGDGLGSHDTASQVIAKTMNRLTIRWRSF